MKVASVVTRKIKSIFILMMIFASLNMLVVNAQEELILFTFGDSITAGLIALTNGGTSASCPSGISLDESYSGSGNLRCFGFGAEGVGGYQPEVKQSFEEFGYDVSIYNYGYSGITTAEMVNEISSDLNQRPNSDYVLLMGGANDAFAGISASSVKNNMQNMVNQVCAKGMIPMLATITRNYIGSYASTVSSYNTNIRQIDAGSSTCEVFLAEQYYALSSRGDYGADGLHLTSQGNSKMASEWFQSMDLEDLTAVVIPTFIPAVILLLLDD